ncbi:MAG TPA: hypothetical protein VJM15_08100 [Sphingomicrobium sp.]|nr:hypothetical protein [Sphingomicrobium sp.]
MRIILFPLVFLAAAAAAQVTDPGVPGDPGDTIAPKNITPIGNPEMVARSMLLAMKLQQKQRELCWELGCLVIVNESSSYEVAGFHVQEKRKDGSLGWSRNQFGRPLMPRRATFRFKSGGPDTCDQPVKFVLKRPKTRDGFEFETRVSLCRSPQRDSLVRIRAVIPEVEVKG